MHSSRILKSKRIGAANLNWKQLLFDCHPTNGFMLSRFSKGSWSEPEFQKNPFVSLHAFSNVFHYGQSVFEGLKVFHLRHGGVGAFSDILNFERINGSCAKMRMPTISYEHWKTCIDETVLRNLEFLPPHGSGASMYIRPVMIGSSPQLGVAPAKDFMFMVLASPVGSYYSGGSIKGVNAYLSTEHDRTAPRGIGDSKASANYAADLNSLMSAKEKGFPVCLYLDPVERKYVTEFNTSNFIAILPKSTSAAAQSLSVSDESEVDFSQYIYVTPKQSRLILDSVTNRRLSQLAEHLGMTVERRDVDFYKDASSFVEVGAVGTAVVITPVASIFSPERGGLTFKYRENPIVLKQLLKFYTAIQTGDAPDTFGWLRTIKTPNN